MENWTFVNITSPNGNRLCRSEKINDLMKMSFNIEWKNEEKIIIIAYIIDSSLEVYHPSIFYWVSE